MTTDSIELGNTIDNSTGESTGVAYINRAYVDHRFGKHVSAKVGRFNQVISNGYFYDDAFDGAQINIGNDKIQFQGAHGYFLKGMFNGTSTDMNDTVSYASLKGQPNKHISMGGFYARMNSPYNMGFIFRTFYGFHTDINLDKVWVGGEWVKAAGVSHGSAWTAGLGYGNYDQAKRGSWYVKAQYFNFGQNLGAASSTWDIAYDRTNTAWMATPGGAISARNYQGFKGWLLTADYALQKNVGLTAYYGFNNKTNKATGDNEKLSNYYRLDLNYQF